MGGGAGHSCRFQLAPRTAAAQALGGGTVSDSLTPTPMEVG